jgi:nucleotide-binding universal stress UspA family protein
MFKKILVPTDGSDLSIRAIDEAIDYARLAGSTIIGMSVIEPYPAYLIAGDAALSAAASLAESAETVVQDNMKSFVLRVTAAGLPHETSVVTSASPWAAIVEAAQMHHCDAIFMGSHGRRGLDAVLMGSVTHNVLTHCTVPVMVLR